MAPFNRYQTIDVVRAVCQAGRQQDVVLYTGNDDNIVVDLLTECHFNTSTGTKSVRIKGGLLGHWAVWTKNAVEMFHQINDAVEHGDIKPEMLTLAAAVTDCNAAFFDVANNFKGCIAGIHEVLRRQSLLDGIWCLNPQETLSPGQAAEIDRVYHDYPQLNDDDFIRQNLQKWLID